MTLPGGAFVSLKDTHFIGGNTGVLLTNGSPASGPLQLNVERSSFTQFFVAGIQASDTNATISDSNFELIGGFSAASAGAICMATSTTPQWFINNDKFSFNNDGLSLAASCSARLSNSTFSQNTTGISSASANVVSYRNNVFVGNGTDGAPSMSTSFK